MVSGEDKVNEPIARGGIPSRITGRASIYYPFTCTLCGHRIAHRKLKETKQEPGTAGPGNMLGCCLVSFYFLFPHPVHDLRIITHKSCKLISHLNVWPCRSTLTGRSLPWQRTAARGSTSCRRPSSWITQILSGEP